MGSNIQTILIILLAAGYLILLLCAIVAAYIIIRILQSLRHITHRAETTTENMSELVKALGRKLAPVAVSTLIGTILKRVKNRRSAKLSEDEDD